MPTLVIGMLSMTITERGLAGASSTRAAVKSSSSASLAEAPAKPRSVIVIETMPMTNVGKIYKPELRAMAARKVATTMVDEACAALGIADSARPQVQADGDSALKVIVDAAAAGAQAETLRLQLHEALGRLPFKTQVILK